MNQLIGILSTLSIAVAGSLLTNYFIHNIYYIKSIKIIELIKYILYIYITLIISTIYQIGSDILFNTNYYYCVSRITIFITITASFIIVIYNKLGWKLNTVFFILIIVSHLSTPKMLEFYALPIITAGNENLNSLFIILFIHIVIIIISILLITSIGRKKIKIINIKLTDGVELKANKVKIKDDKIVIYYNGKISIVYKEKVYRIDYIYDFVKEE